MDLPNRPEIGLKPASRGFWQRAGRIVGLLA